MRRPRPRARLPHRSQRDLRDSPLPRLARPLPPDRGRSGPAPGQARRVGRGGRGLPRPSLTLTRATRPPTQTQHGPPNASPPLTVPWTDAVSCPSRALSHTAPWAASQRPHFVFAGRPGPRQTTPRHAWSDVVPFSYDRRDSRPQRFLRSSRFRVIARRAGGSRADADGFCARPCGPGQLPALRSSASGRCGRRRDAPASRPWRPVRQRRAAESRLAKRRPAAAWP